MAKYYRGSRSDDDRDRHDEKRFGRKKRRKRRSRDVASRLFPPPLAPDEFESFLLENEFDDFSGFDAEEGELADSDGVANFDTDYTEP